MKSTFELTSPVVISLLMTVASCSLLLTGNPCVAQGTMIPISVEVSIDSSLNRSGGPIPLDIHVHYFGSKVGIAGDLAFRLVSLDGSLMGTYLFEGLYIPNGEQSYQFLIQPPTSGIWQDAFDFFPIFTSSEGNVYQLPEQLLRLPGSSRRSCVITTAALSGDDLRIKNKQLTTELAFEYRLPGFADIPTSQKPVMTLFRTLEIQDFPTHPLNYCVSDIVFLPGETFSRLSERQTTALLAWVRAGGSLLMFLDASEKLSGNQLSLLNEFLDAPPDKPLVSQLSNGKLQGELTESNPLLMREVGLGRVALGEDSSSPSLIDRYGEERVRQLYIHLWKVTREQAREMMTSTAGNWSMDPGIRYTLMHNQNFEHYSSSGIENFASRFRSTPTAGGNGLLEATLPQGMEMIPLWWIGLTLFFYVLAIGPGDYLLLGAFGLRRLTWILFPVITIVFTAGAILSANYKMQGSNSGGRVIVRDISRDGLILRENEISTYVPVRSEERIFTAQRELFTPISPRQLGVHSQYSVQYQSDSVEKPPVYRGRFPVEAQLIQRVHRWSPEMLRRMRIPEKPTAEESGFDWSLPIQPLDARSYLELNERIQKSFGEEVHAFLIRRDGRDDSARVQNFHAAEPFDRIVLSGRFELFEDEISSLYVRLQEDLATGTSQNFFYESVNFLKSTSFREEAGMFSVVSQLSPKCDDFLEDLPLLDPTDESTWLLLIVVQAGNNYDIYRQLVKTNTLE